MTQKHSVSFEAIGTKWEIVLGSPLLDTTHKEILAYIEAFDATYSRFRDDSLVRKLADTTAGVEPVTQVFPESAEDIFAFYESLFELTEGAVTPLVGDTLESAGYDAKYSLTPGRIIAPKNYKKTVSRKGATITVHEPTLIDIGAAGKGYLVDAIVAILQAAGHTEMIVDGSGDLRVVGIWTEKIGLENPATPNEVIGAVDLHNRALCASAVNRRKWGEWHHVINPKTALPVDDIVATWVIADTAMIADGLATALFFTSPNVLKTKYNYEYLRVYANGTMEFSDYFAKGVF